jgi:hypothetical protein
MLLIYNSGATLRPAFFDYLIERRLDDTDLWKHRSYLSA